MVLKKKLIKRILTRKLFYLKLIDISGNLIEANYFADMHSAPSSFLHQHKNNAL